MPEKQAGALGQLIARCGRPLARALQETDPPRGATEVIRRSEEAVTLRVTGRRRSVAVKLFEPEAAGAGMAFTRELRCLTALAGRRLAPPLLGAAPEALAVITEWQEGPTLEARIPSTDPVTVARHLGAWHAGFARAMPQRPMRSDWASYLARYGEQGLADALAPHRATLAAVPIHAEAVARNDAHPSNFLLGPAGRLIGVDFAAATLKPTGWDLLLAARVLLMWYPNRPAGLLEALCAGAGIAGEDEGLRRVIRIFAETAARSLPAPGGRNG